MKSNDSNTEQLRSLREARQELIKKATARMKEQRRQIRAIREQLAGGPRTVPEIAEATGMGSAEVLWFVAALKKYGEVLEDAKDGGYFRYRLAARAEAEGSA
jgi:biotin operon repressor